MILLDLHGVLLNLTYPMLRNKGYWVNMPRFPWYDDLIELCAEFDDITLCTAPNDYNIGFMFDWYRYNLNHLPIIFTKEKHLCQGVLIDDFEANNPEILFPQPYNFNSDLVGYELSYVRSELERIYDVS